MKLKVAIALSWILGLVPSLWSAFKLLASEYGANPIERMIHLHGIWCVHFLLLTLLCSRIGTTFRKPTLIKLRKHFGLLSYIYLLAHLSLYFVFDQSLNLVAVVEDIQKRKYIASGMVGLLLLTPLALTSNSFSLRKLGAKTWRRLHLLIYPALLAGLVHFWWLTKRDYTRPILYSSIALALLLLRLATRKKASQKS